MSLKDIAYTHIKERIINCDYMPGSFLSEREIIEELGISRTPFREAANALEREGLVELVPHRGILVTAITLKDVIDLYRIREQLEPFTVSLAMSNVPDSVLDEHYIHLEQALETVRFEQQSAVQEDEDLHKMLLRYADNRLLAQMMDEIYDHNHRIRVLSIHQQSIVQLTRQQHFEIISHMRSKNLPAATDAMLRHITSSKDRAIDAILRGNDNYRFELK